MTTERNLYILDVAVIVDPQLSSADRHLGESMIHLALPEAPWSRSSGAALDTEEGGNTSILKAHCIRVTDAGDEISEAALTAKCCEIGLRLSALGVPGMRAVRFKIHIILIHSSTQSQDHTSPAS